MITYSSLGDNIALYISIGHKMVDERFHQNENEKWKIFMLIVFLFYFKKKKIIRLGFGLAVCWWKYKKLKNYL